MWQFLRKLGINLLHYPAIPLLGIYPRDAQSYCKNIYLTMFLAALFVIARNWKQSRCPTIEEWIGKVWHIYTLEFYSAVKINNILNLACKWMEIENALLGEVIQIQKKGIWYVLTHKWILAIVKGL